MIGCQVNTIATKENKRDYSTYTDLAQVLRNVGGLDVRGTGSNAKVYMRGISSIELETQPLYVIDDVSIGNDYAMANNAINPKDIDRVIVLTGSSGAIRYGNQAKDGVIRIITRQQKEEEEDRNK